MTWVGLKCPKGHVSAWLAQSHASAYRPRTKLRFWRSFTVNFPISLGFQIFLPSGGGMWCQMKSISPRLILCKLNSHFATPYRRRRGRMVFKFFWNVRQVLPQIQQMWKCKTPPCGIDGWTFAQTSWIGKPMHLFSLSTSRPMHCNCVNLFPKNLHWEKQIPHILNLPIFLYIRLTSKPRKIRPEYWKVPPRHHFLSIQSIEVVLSTTLALRWQILIIWKS